MKRLCAAMLAVFIIQAVAGVAGETFAVMREANLAVSGMVCSSCSALVEKTLEKMPGVTAAHADIKADQVTVRYDASRVTPHQMTEALRKAGYQARWPEQRALTEGTPRH